MQAYSEMIDSELAYLGMIPRSWRLTPASMLFNENRQNNQSLISQTPLQFKMGNIIRKNVDVDDKLREEIKRYTVVDKNDIMVNGLNLNYDFATQRVALVGESGCITPAYIALRTRENYLPRYANYLLKALDGQKVLNGWGTGIRLTLNFTEFKKYRLPEPNTETQEKIADFLDTETAQIDNLIAKQERLLELLEEKRRATITHAVTRGLNPGVELKETNIPWLGHIPAHWGVERVAALYRRKRVKNHPDEELLSVYRDYGVIIKSSRDDNHNTESEDLSNYQLVEPDDLVTNKMKTWQGSIAVSEIRGIVSPAYFILSPTSQTLNPRYVHYQLRSDRYIAQYKSISKGIRPGQWDLDYEQFRIMCLTVPPIGEQAKIVKHIEDNEIRTKAIKQKIQTQITLLRERRTSLISHVVTGKVMI